MRLKKFFRFLFSILLANSAGFLGSFFTASSVKTWYQTINKPFFNPPSFVFAPVWTLLYILMGVSFYLIWQQTKFKSKISKLARNIFLIQLILNALWSILFFGFKNPVLAFIEIIILWILIFKNIKVFAKINKTAAYLLWPYLAWVSFASILNLSLILLN